jgi:hypothetical protein
VSMKFGSCRACGPLARDRCEGADVYRHAVIATLARRALTSRVRRSGSKVRVRARDSLSGLCRLSLDPH